MITYSEYVINCNHEEEDTFICNEEAPKKGRRRHKRIAPEDKFDEVNNLISHRIKEKKYKNQAEAQQDLENHVQGCIGPIGFFLFKTLIGWLIGRWLTKYFYPDE